MCMESCRVISSTIPDFPVEAERYRSNKPSSLRWSLFSRVTAFMRILQMSRSYSLKTRVLNVVARWQSDFLAKCRLMIAEGETHGAIRQEGSLQSEEGDAREKARYAEVGALGEEGAEQEAGDRDPAFRGSSRWRQSSEDTDEPKQEEEVSPLHPSLRRAVASAARG